MTTKGFIGLVCLWSLLFFSACQPQSNSKVDNLNTISYSYHYRNLDSVYHYASKALAISGNYDDGKAEAMNNLAFYYISKMQYGKADTLLDSVTSITDNQVELLVADVQHMRLCQRRSYNKEFYDYHERAIRRLRRIDEEKGVLSGRLQLRYIYASTEFNIVTSTYYYYVGLERQCAQAIHRIDPEGDLRKDTAQYLNYLYNVGSGGIITEGTQDEINQQEFDNLIRCYMLAQKYHYPFFEANSLQAMSEHLMTPEVRDKLIADNLPAMKFINKDMMPDSLLAGNLALRSMDIFNSFGDVYQIAGAYRTLASCYWQIKDYNSAIACLQNALEKDTAINQAPDLVASIREQLSIVYSAVNDKHNSDYNRNIYLDLQEQTRQDRYYESRADQLARSSAQLNWMIMSVVLMIILVILLLFAFHRLRLRNDKKNSLDELLNPLRQWQKRYDEHMEQMSERYDTITEEYAASMSHIVDSKRRNLEQRAKISLVNSIIPFIDRILNEIKRLVTRKEPDDVRKDRYTYIAELTDKINDYNSVLTEWIQLRQGQLSLHIESFALQDLFDVVSKSRMSFQLKGVTLDVKKTDAVVKADRILTLFMINTIADNARKFTEKGGKVTISSTTADKYVEVSIADNGIGMTDEELSGIFDHKIYNGHGFGLMNCRGIIDKYKKISPIFSVCSLSAESKKGVGSRFFFRLPKGIVRLLLALSIMAFPVHSVAATSPLLEKAAAFADSTYYSNIAGTYDCTVAFADSSMKYLNKFYLEKQPNGKNLMVMEGDVVWIPAEIKWFHDSLQTNYQVIMTIRNETAVAALALHNWQLYRYNNKAYTQLFKENSADATLDNYCRVMQRSETNKNVAMAFLLLLLLSIFPAYYIIYYRHRVYFKYCIEQVKRVNSILLDDTSDKEKLRKITPIPTDRFPEQLKDIVQKIKEALKTATNRNEASLVNIELADDELRRAEYENQKLYITNSVLDNCLSTLKHETMYYPSRIRQLIDGSDDNLQSIRELAEYYKELYSILSTQAMRQVESVKLVCKPFNVSEVLKDGEWKGDDLELLGDKDMVVYMMSILRKQNNDKDLDIQVSRLGSQYASLKVRLSEVNCDQEECMQLFSPSRGHLPYLLCRQIARDNGEATNCRGCGITATPSDKGVVISVVLTARK